MNWPVGNGRDRKFMLCSMSQRVQLVLRWYFLACLIREGKNPISTRANRLLWNTRMPRFLGVYKEHFRLPLDFLLLDVWGNKKRRDWNQIEIVQFHQKSINRIDLICNPSSAYNFISFSACVILFSGDSGNEHFFHLYFCDIVLFKDTSRLPRGNWNPINAQSHV